MPWDEEVLILPPAVAFKEFCMLAMANENS